MATEAELITRYEALSDPLLAMHKSSWAGTNERVMYKSIIDNLDDTLMIELEGFESEVAAEISESAGVAKGLKDQNNGRLIMALMKHLNDERSVTELDVTTFLADAGVQTAKALLESGSLNTAKSHITSMDISGIVATEADRTKILAEIDKHL